MLYAVIDIGSSIIKYKIYEYSEGKIEPIIIHDKTMGLISYRKDNLLTDEGIDVLLNTLKELKTYSDKLHVDKITLQLPAYVILIINKRFWT